MLTLEEWRLAVRLARQAFIAYTENKKIIEPRGLPSIFKEKRGVFATLHKDGGLAPSALDHAVPLFFLLSLRSIRFGDEVGIAL